MDELATNWIESFSVRSSMKPHDRTIVQDMVIDMTADDPVRALEFARLVISKTADHWAIENLGAGVMESLLGVIPEEVIDMVLTHPRVEVAKRALSHVWTSSLSDDLTNRIRGIIGN